MTRFIRSYYEAALIFLLLVFSSCVASAQTQIDLSSQSRNVDFSTARSVIPFPTGTALPPTCSPGSLFFKTDSRSGANIYGCTSQDVWTMQGNQTLTWGSIGGTLTNQTDLNAALSGKADTSLSNLSNASTARSNLGLGTAATQPAAAFANSVHQHGATDITSGTIPAARLGSGTADSTTILYGDNVFRPAPITASGLAGPSASVNSGAITVSCGATCGSVNGFPFSSFSGQIANVGAGTYPAYIYADLGVMKFGYPSSTSAPGTCASITCVSGVSAMPTGANIVSIATVAVSNGVVASVTDARNALVGQAPVYVAGTGISEVVAGNQRTWNLIPPAITPGGTNGQIQYNNGGSLGGISTTGTGNAVLATSPTLVTPVLGTATATTINGTAIPTGGTLLEANSTSTFGSAAVLDARNAAHTLIAKTGPAGNKPSTCTPGEEYFATDATPGQNKFYCTSANTWTRAGSGGPTGVSQACFRVNYDQSLLTAATTRVSLSTGLTLPDNSVVLGSWMKTNIAFAGVAGAGVSIGNSVSDTAYANAYDLTQGVSVTNIQAETGFGANTAASHPVLLIFTGNANLSGLTAGQVDACIMYQTLTAEAAPTVL